ncbi:uncharacterized protein [Halyomorpha halys]|uniref:uncharacterized protein isoform X2 n=1 Tax=Halyomorpha halys TaxID=286706 RepID=UPI0006D506B6|nr:uncharacterized protein LOC106680608 isoform X2 [Halyomorpha halys]
MKNEPMFTPSYSIKTKTQITNKVTMDCITNIRTGITARCPTEEFDKGLNPSGNIQLSNNHPAPALPVGSYDSGEGYFNPFSREMIHPITGKFLRIPSQSERRWILNHCRREWITPLPFDPTLYENWFPKYNEEISVKKKSIWQTIHDCFGEMSGMEGKIESLITFKPSSLNTSKDKLAEINTLMNKSFYAQPNNNDSLKF